MFLNVIVCDHVICTNFYFYFFPYFSYNVTLGKMLILLNSTLYNFSNKPVIPVNLLESQVYWKN